MDQVILLVDGKVKQTIDIIGKTYSITVENEIGNVEYRRKDGEAKITKRAFSRTEKVGDLWHNSDIICN